jgi:hypothetical protein
MERESGTSATIPNYRTYLVLVSPPDGLAPDPDLPRALPLRWTVVAIAMGGGGLPPPLSPLSRYAGKPHPAPPGGGGSHGDSREEAVPGRTPEYDLLEQVCEIRWCSLVVLHIENRCTRYAVSHPHTWAPTRSPPPPRPRSPRRSPSKPSGSLKFLPCGQSLLAGEHDRRDLTCASPPYGPSRSSQLSQS